MMLAVGFAHCPTVGVSTLSAVPFAQVRGGIGSVPKDPDTAGIPRWVRPLSPVFIRGGLDFVRRHAIGVGVFRLG
jgi:hypothetical protein